MKKTCCFSPKYSAPKFKWPRARLGLFLVLICGWGLPVFAAKMPPKKDPSKTSCESELTSKTMTIDERLLKIKDDLGLYQMLFTGATQTSILKELESETTRLESLLADGAPLTSEDVKSLEDIEALLDQIPQLDPRAGQKSPNRGLHPEKARELMRFDPDFWGWDF